MYSSIAINYTIAQKIDTSNQNSRIILFDNIPPSSFSNVISANGFLKNLKAYSNITSLAEAGLPNILLEDTDQDRLIKAMNIEWGSERIQLDLEASADGINFIKVGAISLIHQMGYPYRNYSLLDFFTDGLAGEVGTNGKIACFVKDAGYGKLTANDELTIYGSVTQEIVLNISSVENSNYYTVQLTSAATKILDANSNRKGLIVFNDSAVKIYLGFNNAIDSLNYSIPLIPSRGYEFPQPIFTGDIYAYAEVSVNLQVTEFE
jgi:hypothetical protein